MRVPYFRAKDKDSEQWVEGFYVEFPESSDFTHECKLVHAIMVVVPDAKSIPMMPMLGMFGDDAKKSVENAISKRNTLNFCTIDIHTLQLVGEVEIGSTTFKPEGYIKSANSSIVIG